MQLTPPPQHPGELEEIGLSRGWELLHSTHTDTHTWIEHRNPLLTLECYPMHTEHTVYTYQLEAPPYGWGLHRHFTLAGGLQGSTSAQCIDYHQEIVRLVESVKLQVCSIVQKKQSTIDYRTTHTSPLWIATLCGCNGNFSCRAMTIIKLRCPV